MPKSKGRKKNHKKRMKLSPQLKKELNDKQKEHEQEDLSWLIDVSDENYHWHYKIRVIVFFAIFFIGAIFAFIIPLRPNYSAIEQRNLTSFPKWNFEEFVNGDYFDDINTWFADTFPGREGWIGLKSVWETMYGFGGSRMYGKVDRADDIPDVSGPDEPVVTLPTTEKTTKSNKETTTTAAVTTTTVAPTTTTTLAETDRWEDEQGPNVKSETQNGILVRGNTAYEYYSFSTESANKYAASVKKVAEQVKGKANVYDIAIPTSIGVMLDEKARAELQSSDQEKAIRYIYSQMGSDVKTVPILNLLREHNDEYLYFHTDHHWTARAAYYAYAALRTIQGKDAEDIDSYETVLFDRFKGSFFANTNNSNLAVDTVTAYYPNCENSMYFIQEDGTRLDWKVIYDVSEWAARSKYNCFIGGDNPFTEITNHELNDGSACVVIKESFGNALVPFLVDHYQTVYVLDYRYYTEMNLAQFVDTYKVQDVIFANNVGAIRTEALMDDIVRLVG